LAPRSDRPSELPSRYPHAGVDFFYSSFLARAVEV